MKQHLLISIDCIVDTRIWAIAQLNAQAARELTADKKNLEKYLLRVTDSFPEYGIDYKTFRETYRKRTIDALFNGAPTAFMLELRKIISAIYDLKVHEPQKVENIEIHLNTYPYQLNEREQLEFIDVVATYVHYPIAVKCVHIPPSSISPFMLTGSDYSALFIYDFEEWMSYHYGLMCADVPEIYMPRIAVHAPFGFISLDKMKTAVELTNPKGETTNPEEAAIFALKRFFAYEPYPLGVFSIAHPEQVANYFTGLGATG